MTATAEEVRAFIDSVAAMQDRINNTVFSESYGLLSGIDLYDRAAVDRAVHQIAQLIASGQYATAALTDSYMKTVGEMLDYGPMSLSGVSVDMAGSLRNGVTLAEAYARVPITYRAEQAAGNPNPMGQMYDRLETMMSLDLMQAFRGQADKSMHTNQITGWRRIVHPERSRSHRVCGLCVVASDRVYTRGNLMPIHARCRCTVLPIKGDKDPKGVLDLATSLDSVYSATESGRTYVQSELKNVRVEVVDHPELGPQLRSITNRSGKESK